MGLISGSRVTAWTKNGTDKGTTHGGLKLDSLMWAYFPSQHTFPSSNRRLNHDTSEEMALEASWAMAKAWWQALWVDEFEAKPRAGRATAYPQPGIAPSASIGSIEWHSWWPDKEPWDQAEGGARTGEAGCISLGRDRDRPIKILPWADALRDEAQRRAATLAKPQEKTDRATGQSQGWGQQLRYGSGRAPATSRRTTHRPHPFPVESHTTLDKPMGDDSKGSMPSSRPVLRFLSDVPPPRPPRPPTPPFKTLGIQDRANDENMERAVVQDPSQAQLADLARENDGASHGSQLVLWTVGDQHEEAGVERGVKALESREVSFRPIFFKFALRDDYLGPIRSRFASISSAMRVLCLVKVGALQRAVRTN